MQPADDAMFDALGYALLIALLLMLGAYLTRTTAVRRLRAVGSGAEPLDATSDKFNLYLSLLTGTQVVGGNTVEILENGDETYPRLWHDLAEAREVICLHVYDFRPGEVADQLLRILSERAQFGVHVLVLLDAVGAKSMPAHYRQRLAAAGAEVAVYRPLRFKEFYKYQQRMHMRAVVVDGRVGFTGGFGIADVWLGNGRDGGWRDTSVRLAGPVAMQLQVAFSNNWAEATGELLVGDAVTPFEQAPPQREPKAAGIMTCSPSLGTTSAERFFFLSIASSRERIYIANAYFVPTRDLRWLLMNAADRGVDVRVLTPGARNDQRVVRNASRALYRQLLDAGIRIWEYQPGMMHAKTFVADGCWATVGTFNFDNRSMKLNDEVALIIRDQDVAQRLEQSFVRDLAYAEEIRPAHLDALDTSERVKARLSRLATPLL
jgi:cardiolipin synthase